MLIYTNPIQWVGVPEDNENLKKFPDEAYLAGLGIEDRIKLLAQAEVNFRDLCPRFLNVRPADLLAAAGTKVGAINPFTGVEFHTYGPIEPATYRSVLRQLALDVSRLRVIAASSTSRQVTTAVGSFSRHQEWTDTHNPPTSDPDDDKLLTFDGETVVEPPTWQPVTIGIGSDVTPTGPASGGSDLISLTASYGETPDGNHPSAVEKSLSWTVTRYQVTSVEAGVPAGWSGGAVAALGRVAWSPWTGSAPQSAGDGTYLVVGSNSTGLTVSVAQPGPGIAIGGGWTPTTDGGASSFVPAGFTFAKDSSYNQIGFDWRCGEPGSLSVYSRDYVCLLIPAFSKGLDASAAASALANLRGVTPPPAADGRALPRPQPGMIFGVNLGPGLDDGTTSAWLAVMPSLSTRLYGSYLLQPLGFGVNWLSFQARRFDCVPALQFVGAESDYQVVYSNSRDPDVRLWPLPSCRAGDSVFQACGWDHQNAFFTAWDAPRIRQVIGKHLLADVIVTGPFSQIIRIYRMDGSAFERTPGAVVDTTALALLRTLTISTPDSLTGLGSGPESLKINDSAGTDLSISLAAMNTYFGDWDFKLTNSSNSQEILWREIWDNANTDPWDNTDWYSSNYTVSLTRDRAAAGSVTGLPGPCHVWPETPASYTRGDVVMSWESTTEENGQVKRVTKVTGELDRVEKWLPVSGISGYMPSGLPRIPTLVRKGQWKAELSLSDTKTIKTQKFLMTDPGTDPGTEIWSRWGTTWEQWASSTAGGDSVKTYSAPNGLVTDIDSTVSCVRTDFGGLDAVAGTMPWAVRRVVASNNTGSLITLLPTANKGLEVITESGRFADESGSAVVRGTRQTMCRDGSGYPVSASTKGFFGTSSVETERQDWAQTGKTDWGAPTSVTLTPSGLNESWSYADDHRNLATWTSALGATVSVTARDLFDRATAGTNNGIGFGITHLAGGTGADETWGAGATAGDASRRVDAVGRLLTDNRTVGGVTDAWGATYDTDTRTIAASNSLTGAGTSTTISASTRAFTATNAANAVGNVLPFSGITGDALTVENGLLLTKTLITGQAAAYQATRTDAWGRVRYIETPSTTGTGVDTTEYVYSAPGSLLQRVLTLEASGRRTVQESDPYNNDGAIIRAGVDKNQSGELEAGDRFVLSITTIVDGNLQTCVSKTKTPTVTDNTGLREVIKTITNHTTGGATITLNGSEETLTRTPNYSANTVTTHSSKGWDNTIAANNLGLPISTTKRGPGVRTTTLSPEWRADGNLASVTLNEAGAITKADFGSNSLLTAFSGPDHSSVQVSHGFSGGKESLTINDVNRTASIDGTQSSNSGGDKVAQTRTLILDGGGFKQTIAPTIEGSSTILRYNAAGVETAHEYVEGGTTSSYYHGGLLASTTLQRGGAREYAYWPDGTKDLQTVNYPSVTSGGDDAYPEITFPAVTEGYSQDLEGQIHGITDNSGTRELSHTNGRLVENKWTLGALAGYRVVTSHDEVGRETGFSLYDPKDTLIHSAGYTFTGENAESDEVADVTSGDKKIVMGREAGRVTGLGWGNATGTFDPIVTQTWMRGASGRVLRAENSVSSGLTYDYRGTTPPEDLSTVFDSQGRRLKCAVAAGEWTYAYDSHGQLHTAILTSGTNTLASFTYTFDGIGRRTDFSANTSDTLNRFVAMTHSQQKHLSISAAAAAGDLPAATVFVTVGNTETEMTPSNIGWSCPMPSPAEYGNWVSWVVRGVVTGGGDKEPNDDAIAEVAGNTWVPPANESFTYDDDGNRESSSLWNYGWDGRNMLVSATTKNYSESPEGWRVTCDYDAEGRRFRKTIIHKTTRGEQVKETLDNVTFIWDGWNLIYERHANQFGMKTFDRKYVWGEDIGGGTGGASGAGGAGGLLLIRETRGQAAPVDYYPLYDGSGHVVGLTDSAGTLVAQYTYGPFGELISASGPMADANPIRYATKYYDKETGLYYYGRRYYDPASGQWLNREPLGEDESLNLYAYCHNDPVNGVDVLGMWQINTQEEANIQRAKWLLMLVSEVNRSPIAPPSQFAPFFPEAGDFGLFKPFGPDDYKRAEELIRNQVNSSMRVATWEEGELAGQPVMKPGLMPDVAVRALTLSASPDPNLAAGYATIVLPVGAGGFLLNGAVKVAQISKLLATGMSLGRPALTGINVEARTGTLLAANGVSPEIRALSEANITDNGITVLGRFQAPPGQMNYIQKATTGTYKGSSYFDLGAAWTPVEGKAANLNFLDIVGGRGDKMIFSTPKNKIPLGTSLDMEVQYLKENFGYKWVNKWSMRK